MRTPPDWTTLRIFLTALELGSIAKAAERCGIANSAAAKRVQMLEADNRVPLLDRHARGVVPTAAGEVFARHAGALLDAEARLAEEMDAFAAGGSGTVRLLATASAIGGHDLAEVLATFAATHPAIRIDLRETTSLPVLQDLLEGRADLGIVTTNLRVPAGLEAQPWREDRLLAVVSAGHPLARRRAVRFNQVLDHPLVEVLEAGALSLLLAEAAQQLGRSPNIRHHVSSMDAARRLVAAGHAVTIMPDGMIEPYAEALRLAGVPLDAPWATRRLRLISRPTGTLSAPVRLLHDHLLHAR
ncbi:LysR family transcriptional regulator [Inquilinus sp. NPDC058860]|uniref:LysR family transcriptional regulator n=1 Tax=Inquilinus sp. NPDC058860 TaxID=3346652 RepID=UPI00367B89E7